MRYGAPFVSWIGPLFTKQADFLPRNLAAEIPVWFESDSIIMTPKSQRRDFTRCGSKTFYRLVKAPSVSEICFTVIIIMLYVISSHIQSLNYQCQLYNSFSFLYIAHLWLQPQWYTRILSSANIIFTSQNTSFHIQVTYSKNEYDEPFISADVADERFISADVASKETL